MAASDLDSRLASALQTQMNRELFASLTYKQMRADLRLAGWYGFHKFMHSQENDELKHARCFDHFLSERGVRPVFTTVQPQPILYSPENPLYYFEAALELEENFWSYLNDIYQMSEDVDDPDTCTLLYKFIDEQHDSVDGLKHIVQKLKRAGTDQAALLIIDKKVQEIYESK